MANDVNQRTFLPGIEGLRCIAVLAVVFNHLDSSLLPGGYLGVDVFFVISGFVISKSLFTSYSNAETAGLNVGRAKVISDLVVEFYVRRIKRLFPALVVMVLLVLIFAGPVLDVLYTSIALTGISSLVGASNIFQILISNDYFGLASKLNIFTHTWSLGVEEQFYLFYPILLFFLLTRGRKLFTPLVGITVSSLILFLVLQSMGKNVFSYYFPLSRFWEISIGAIVFFMPQTVGVKSTQFPQIPLYIQIILCFAVLAVCFSVQPSWIYITAPACCLATAILLIRIREDGVRFLELGPMTFIGKISYSMYLYHIPVIVLLSIGSTAAHSALTLAILFAISILSFYCIEAPCRRMVCFSHTYKGLASLLGGVVLVSLVGTFYSFSIDNRPTFSPAAVPGKSPCFPEILSSGDISKCTLGTSEKGQIFFVGDSHSDKLIRVMNEFSEIGYQAYAISLGGLLTTQFDSELNGNLARGGKQTVDFIKSQAQSGDHLIITNQLMQWFGVTYGSEKYPGLILNGRTLGQEEAFELFLEDIKQLQSLGLNIIVTSPYPDFKVHPIKCYKPLLMFFGAESDDKACRISRTEWEQKRSSIFTGLTRLAETNKRIRIFDPTPLICDQSFCSPFRNSTPIYYDDDHVNTHVSPIVFKALRTIIEDVR